eukprot:5169776-Prymnesium_polylepis.1
MMVELNGTAQALKVMAPRAGIAGDGTAGDPMLAPLAEVVSIVGEAAVMDNALAEASESSPPA